MASLEHQALYQSEPASVPTVSSWSHSSFENFEFSHRWTISQFGLRCSCMNDPLESAPFLSVSPSGTSFEWILRLNPFYQNFRYDRATDMTVYTNYTSLGLMLVSPLKEKIWVQFKLCILDKDCRETNVHSFGISEVRTKTYMGFTEFVDRENLLKRSHSSHLVKDTLTVQCKARVYLLRKPVNTLGHSSQIEVSSFDLSALMTAARKDDCFTDVTVVTRGKEFRAHKVVLATQSTFFKTCFEQRWDRKDDRVEMDDLDPDLLQVLISYLYTGEIPAISKVADRLLAAADEYGIDRLKKLCEKVLSERIKVENVISTLMLANAHHAVTLKGICVEFVVQHACAVLKTDGWLEMKGIPRYDELRMEVLELLAQKSNR